MDDRKLTGGEFIGMKPEDNKMPDNEAKKRSPRKPVKSK